jgi:hypothetical protein
MKRAWHPEELVEHWTIVPGEWPLIEHKHGATRLGFAVLFKFFQYAGYFPRAPQDVPLMVVDHLAQQVGVPADAWAQYAWYGRTTRFYLRLSRGYTPPPVHIPEGGCTPGGSLE